MRNIMKVLWLCNIMLPAYALHENMPFSNREGWLSGCYERIQKEKKEGSCDISLGVCFPVASRADAGMKIIDDVAFYGFVENLETPEVYKPELEERFRDIIRDFDPDMVHIFGTEFPHSLAMVRAFGRPDRTLLGIQGVCAEIASLYMADLPPAVQKDRTLRDIIKHDSLMDQKAKFHMRAEHEKMAVEGAGHLTGRTAFDREVCAELNKKALYHHMNETMRNVFYEGCWTLEGAVPHSIFLSQGDYPLKGFHFMLRALSQIIEKYPDAHVYVAGNSIIGNPDRRTVTVSGENDTGSRYPLFLRKSAYSRYLLSLIKTEKLAEHVTVLGKLNAEQMKEQYLKASVFVCPSIIENSPNSVGEAMLLGTPVVASRTGGIPSMIEEGRDGVLFAPGDVSGLARSIEQIWEEPVITGLYSENARAHARQTHDAALNYARLLEIYHAITGI
jgi:hypothetical protein